MNKKIDEIGLFSSRHSFLLIYLENLFANFFMHVTLNTEVYFRMSSKVFVVLFVLFNSFPAKNIKNIVFSVLNTNKQLSLTFFSELFHIRESESEIEIF